MIETKIDTIKEYLEIHKGMEFNLDAVLEGLGWEKSKKTVSTTRQNLKRLTDDGVINRPHRGFYVYPKEKTSKLDLKKELREQTIQLHNLRLISPNVTDLEVYPSLSTKLQSDSIRDKIRTTLQQTSIEIWEHIGNKDVLKTAWNGRSLEFQKSTRIEIILRAGDLPLDEVETYGFHEFLKGWFSPVNFDAITWSIPYMELNIDLHHVTLTPNMITLQDYEGIFQRWYQRKSGALRRENRIKVPTTLEEVVKNLRGEQPMGIVGLNKQIGILFEGVKELKSLYAQMKAERDKLMEILIDLKGDKGLLLTYRE